MIFELIKEAVSAATFGALRKLKRTASMDDLSRLRNEFGYRGGRVAEDFAPLALSGERGMQALASGDLSSLADRMKSLKTVSSAGLKPKQSYKWPTDTTGDAWDLLKGEIRKNKKVDDLKVGVLGPGETGNLASASTFEALNHVNKDIGVNGIDAGYIINPNVFKKNVLGDRWPSKLREAGMERLYGSSSRKAVRNISLEASDLALANAKGGVRDWDSLEPAVREKLMAGGIRDGADFTQLQRDAEWVPRPNVTYDPRSAYGNDGFNRDLREFDARSSARSKPDVAAVERELPPAPAVEWGGGQRHNTTPTSDRNAADAIRAKHGERIDRLAGVIRSESPLVTRDINRTVEQLRNSIGPVASAGARQARDLYTRWRAGA